MRMPAVQTTSRRFGISGIILVWACFAVLVVYAAYAFRELEFGYRGIVGTAVGLGAYIGLLSAIASSQRRSG